MHTRVTPVGRCALLSVLPVALCLAVGGCPPMTADPNDAGGNTPANMNDGGADNTNGAPGGPVTDGDVVDETILPADNDVAIVSGGVAPAPTVAAPAPTPGANGLLNEVRFAPADGESIFAELLAAAGTDLGGFVLVNQDGGHVVLPAGALADANGIFVVILGGAGAPPNGVSFGDAFLAAASGWIELRNASGALLDRVEWGVDQADGVRLSTGGGAGPEEIIPGFALARRPGETASVPQVWTAYPSSYATPGAPNPHLGVQLLIPPDGALIEPADQVLTWYAADGAAQYRVQIATDESFQSVIVDEGVDTPAFDAGLSVGVYFWRVQALTGDDSAMDFSPIARLEIVDGLTRENVGEDSSDTSVAKSITAQGAAPPPYTSRILMGFPSRAQHKDSPLLLIESDRESGDHRWDHEHVGYFGHDPADAMNCTLASTQMVNIWYLGDVSQDRIGYEVHYKDADGPETDLNFNEGNWPEKPLKFAIGVDVDAKYRHKKQLPKYPVLWDQIRAEINAGRPIVTVKSYGVCTHTRVVIGYIIDRRRLPNKAYVVVHDPANPGKTTAKYYPEEFYHFANTLVSYYRIPAGAAITPAIDEASIRTDTDGDGVSDFDEQMRFMTDKAKRDTDGDCISDYDEIRRSVFDPEHGYGVFTSGGKGDNQARAHYPPERSIDTDGGGTPDFIEDWDRDGKTGNGDSDPYDKSDDGRKISGTFERFSYWYPFPEQLNDIRSKVTLTLETQADGTLSGMMTVKQTDVRDAMLTNSDTNCPQPRKRKTTMQEQQYTTKINGEFMCTAGDPVLIYLSVDADPHRAPLLNVPITIDDECYGVTIGAASSVSAINGFATNDGTVTATGPRGLRSQFTPPNADTPENGVSNLRFKWDISVTGK